MRRAGALRTGVAHKELAATAHFLACAPSLMQIDNKAQSWTILVNDDDDDDDCATSASHLLNAEVGRAPISAPGHDLHSGPNDSTRADGGVVSYHGTK